MFRIIPGVIIIITSSLATELPFTSPHLNQLTSIELTWNCSNYAQGKTSTYQEIFAKDQSKLRIERWFVLPGTPTEPDSRFVFIGYGAEGTLYSPCCKRKTVKTSDLNPQDILLELAYEIDWWTDLSDARQVEDYGRSRIIYVWPYKRVYLDQSTKLPLEIQYFHLKVKYPNYTEIEGIGPIPTQVLIYNGDKLVFEKKLSISETPSGALFNSENLPFKEGEKAPSSLLH